MRSKIIFTHTFVFVLFTFAACYPQSSGSPVASHAGYYKGRAFNTTANAHGNTGFELYDINKQNGHVRAYAIFSDGLEGEAWLTGKMTDNGELDLSGTLGSYRMEIRGQLAGNGSITADYSLEGANPQRGNFEVSFVEAIPATMADDSSFRTSAISDLIGAWEVGGALPGQINPITERRWAFPLSMCIGSNSFPTGASNTCGPTAIVMGRTAAASRQCWRLGIIRSMERTSRSRSPAAT